MSKRLQQGSGSPSFCWHCSKQLMRAPGKGKGLFFFHVVIDQDGIEHRVHGDCAAMVIGDGVKLKSVS